MQLPPIDQSLKSKSHGNALSFTADPDKIGEVFCQAVFCHLIAQKPALVVFGPDGYEIALAGKMPATLIPEYQGLMLGMEGREHYGTEYCLTEAVLNLRNLLAADNDRVRIINHAISASARPDLDRYAFAGNVITGIIIADIVQHAVVPAVKAALKQQRHVILSADDFANSLDSDVINTMVEELADCATGRGHGRKAVRRALRTLEWLQTFPEPTNAERGPRQ